jgi:AcrR family transcriptional regulator
MARTLNIAEHAVRRDSFVDIAQRLIQTKGYEQMSIQDVLDELDASRGAFYHYFHSKAALLQAVVERMVDAVMTEVAPLAADPEMGALDKLQSVFAGIAQWKNARKELLLALMKVWLSDENAIVREKLRQAMVARLTPLLAAIVRQGRDEGVFAVGASDETARVLVSMMQGANEEAVRLFMARQAGNVSFAAVERFVAAYADALDRILGLPQGAMTFVDEATLKQWYG